MAGRRECSGDGQTLSYPGKPGRREVARPWDIHALSFVDDKFAVVVILISLYESMNDKYFILV